MANPNPSGRRKVGVPIDDHLLEHHQALVEMLRAEMRLIEKEQGGVPLTKATVLTDRFDRALMYATHVRSVKGPAPFTWLILLPAFLAAAFVLATDPAQAEMKNQWVEYSHGDTKLKAYVVYDDQMTGLPC